ncbi:MAG: hypothetical protein PHX05_00090 [Acidobacteriota bacterium]|nr:hypothetical protein [Acidobacteriota bacterium]
MVIWAVQGALGLVMAIGGFTVCREFRRNDEQETRIRVVEQAIVEMSYIRRDVAETKQDVKRLMERGHQ